MTNNTSGPRSPRGGFGNGNRNNGANRNGYRGGNDAPRRPGNAPRNNNNNNRGVTQARVVTLEALMDVEMSGAYGSLALDKRLSEAYLPQRERAFVTGMFYGVIERRIELEYILSKVMDRPMDIPQIQILLRMGAYQLFFMDSVPDFAACTQTVEHCRKLGKENLCPMINGVMRALTRIPRPIEYPADPVENLSIRYSTPKWLVERLLEDFPMEETEKLLAYKPDEYTATIRPNLLKTDVQRLREMLRAQNYAPMDGALPDTLHVRGNAAMMPAYRRGLCSIQSEPSMLAAYAVTVKPGWSVLDACAAPGGKTCLMAEQMGGSGRVYAWDVHEHRTKLVTAYAGRLGLDNVRTRVQDSAVPVPSQEGMMNAVLVDAPCSGLGVAVNKPDIKYRLTAENVANLPDVQKKILETCSRYVRPGGILVYSTCTILKAENEDIVRDFLDKHPEFVLEGLEKALPEPFASKVENGMLQLMPYRDGVEGFFVARMVKKG